LCRRTEVLRRLNSLTRRRNRLSRRLNNPTPCERILRSQRVPCLPHRNIVNNRRSRTTPLQLLTRRSSFAADCLEGGNRRAAFEFPTGGFAGVEFRFGGGDGGEEEGVLRWSGEFGFVLCEDKWSENCSEEKGGRENAPRTASNPAANPTFHSLYEPRLES
jgi:hypothetical protein